MLAKALEANQSYAANVQAEGCSRWSTRSTNTECRRLADRYDEQHDLHGGGEGERQKDELQAQHKVIVR